MNEWKYFYTTVVFLLNKQSHCLCKNCEPMQRFMQAIYLFAVRFQIIFKSKDLVKALGTGPLVALVRTGVNVPGSGRDLVLDDGRVSLLAADERRDGFWCCQETVDDLCWPMTSWPLFLCSLTIHRWRWKKSLFFLWQKKNNILFGVWKFV